MTPGGRRSRSRAPPPTTRTSPRSRSSCATTPRARALASDGTWSTDVHGGWYRITPANLNAAGLRTGRTPRRSTCSPGRTRSGRATDDLGLTTSRANQGRLTSTRRSRRRSAERPAQRHRQPTGVDRAPPRPGRHGDRRQRRGERPGRDPRPTAAATSRPTARSAAAFATLDRDAGHTERRPAPRGRCRSTCRRRATTRHGLRLRHRRPAGHVDQRGDGAVPDLPG